MDLSVTDVLVRLAGVMALVLANGFFVAAEFSIVTVRKTRIDQLIAEGLRTARAVRRAVTDPDSYSAATQLGITMASIGLGWIGEPALASMIMPALHALPAQLGYVKDGYVEALLAQDCYGWGTKSVEILLDKIIKNQSPPDVKVIDPLTLVTKENVDSYAENWKKWLKK